MMLHREQCSNNFCLHYIINSLLKSLLYSRFIRWWHLRYSENECRKLLPYFLIIEKWLRFNIFTLNIEEKKTKYLPFSSYNNLESLEVNSSIPESKSAKYLGITIDRNLKWDLHINNRYCKNIRDSLKMVLT